MNTFGLFLKPCEGVRGKCVNTRFRNLKIELLESPFPFQGQEVNLYTGQMKIKRYKK